MDDLTMKRALEDWRNHRRIQAVTGFLKREWPVIAWLVSFTLISVAIWNNHTLAVDTNGSLCTLRADLEQRVQSSKDFLREHPNGIPGISAKTIQQGIDNQTQTIVALNNLNCN